MAVSGRAIERLRTTGWMEVYGAARPLKPRAAEESIGYQAYGTEGTLDVKQIT